MSVPHQNPANVAVSWVSRLATLRRAGVASGGVAAGSISNCPTYMPATRWRASARSTVGDTVPRSSPTTVAPARVASTQTTAKSSSIGYRT